MNLNIELQILLAFYSVGQQNFESFMLDISPAGVFIKTDEAFFIGQQIKLSFTLPN